MSSLVICSEPKLDLVQSRGCRAPVLPVHLLDGSNLGRRSGDQYGKNPSDCCGGSWWSSCFLFYAVGDKIHLFASLVSLD